MFPVLALFAASFAVPPSEAVDLTVHDLPTSVTISACDISDVRDNRIKLRIQGTYTGTATVALHLQVVVKHRNHALGDLDLQVPLQPGQDTWQQVVWVKLSDTVRPFAVEINFQRLE